MPLHAAFRSEGFENLAKRIEPAFRWHASILVGNGLNRAYGAPSWAEMMPKLKPRHPRRRSSPQHDFGFAKPFIAYPDYRRIPHLLTYEAFAHQRGGRRYLQHSVEQVPGKFDTGELHQRIMDLPANILTTNFDFVLEDAIGSGRPRNHQTFESRSMRRAPALFQFQQARDKTVWHVHGHIGGEILFGFRPYIKILNWVGAYIYDYDRLFDDGIGSRSPYALGVNGTPTQAHLPRSWIDLFIGTDLHIIGLTLGFEETILWWMITLRRLLTNSLQNCDVGPRVGTTTYCDVGTARQRSKFEADRERALRSFNIEIVRIVERDWESAYAEALRRIEEKVVQAARLNSPTAYKGVD